jgi:hypothetical protein
MEHGVIEAYEDNQLAVAISDLRAVGNALDEYGAAIPSEERDPRLGLALLTLGNLPAAVGQLKSKDSGLLGRAMQARWPDGPPSGIQLSDLDLLIYSLREQSRAHYSNWVPTIGKNRVIEPVRGLPYIGGGGEGDPYFGGSGDPRTSPGPNAGTIAQTAIPSGVPAGWPPRRTKNPGQGVRVGVLDTRVYPHEWLAGAYFTAGDELLTIPAAGKPLLSASAGHATFIAGLILCQAPGAKLDIRPVLDDSAVGKAWDVAKEMASFAGSGVDILNMSYGCYTDDGEPPLVLARAVSLLSAEILLVAAAGNHGNIDVLRAQNLVPNQPWTQGLTPVTPVWPAAFDEVTAVGAMDGNEVAAFSPQTPWVDLLAPGVNVESTYLTAQVKPATPGAGSPLAFTGFANWDGTSFSAATVSGAVAARIEPGRCDARQALEYIGGALPAGIRPA